MLHPTLVAAPFLMYAIGAGVAAPASAAGAENGPLAAETALAPQAADAGKYSGFMDLVNNHREAQVKMVKKWRELKGQTPPTEATMQEYKKLQEETQKASNKVTKFMQQSRWTADDRKAMEKIWGDVLAKDVP